MSRLSKPFINIIEKLREWNATVGEEFARVVNEQSDTTFVIQSVEFQNNPIFDSTPSPSVLIEFTRSNFQDCDYQSVHLTIPISYPKVPPTVLLKDRKGNFHSYKILFLDLWENEPSVFNLSRLIHILINQTFPRQTQSQVPQAPPKPKPPATNTTNLTSSLHSLSLNLSKPPVPEKPSSPIACRVSSPSTEKIFPAKNKDNYSSPSLPPRPAPYTNLVQNSFRPNNTSKDSSSLQALEKQEHHSSPVLPPKQKFPPVPSKPHLDDSLSQTNTNAVPINKSTVNLLDEEINFPIQPPNHEDKKLEVTQKRLDETKSRWKEKLDAELMQQIKTFQSLRQKKELLDNEKRSLQELAKEIDRKRFLLGMTRRKLKDELRRTITIENLPIEELFIIPSEADRKKYKLSSNDAILNNSIQALNSALTQESISVHAWLKAVKLLARKQFFVRDDLLHL
ncbi:ESCRT I complex subunit Vps23 [Schizosaccharomyces cryophilus OY26]|uniref:ESCRT I complex subunit Vps23 n=1 Tax=Schizosaccharomyces cryophilus (strain OY26 / ATCC MYA-4695 / CBS 11777 / NBRC 106824 / NRRL Y48691) TaxID=653667 RepID=S9X079_SCHCR|nr:ESCRT I complex subunit Vps23 [Schizosaccharomyces cryophilus OY26]EPY50342.1 ESCRT I complex subunit Vps23 [Schizosaccharomyces cryophilus OY26]